ncbi:MAG TPA: hypothetical protein VG712_00755, partial [Gemmatimonadales bacterium]|nr:hypothetical protein [Gemmatimonadales bacterium]
GATILFGPLVQLQTAAIAAGVAEVSRLRPGSPEVRRHIVRSTVFTTGAAVLNLALVLLVPDRFGELLLGDSWRITRMLLWPAGAQFVLVGLISGVRSTLLGVKALATTVRVDIAGSVLTFAFSVGGAMVLDIRGAFWCLAAAQGLVAVLWWAAFFKDGRGHETEGEQWTSPA